MSKKRPNKEPSVVRSCPDGTLLVSREWIGWQVLHNEKLVAPAVCELLQLAAERIAANYPIPADKKVVISTDGRAIVSFV